MNTMHMLRHAHDEGYEEKIDRPPERWSWLDAVGWFYSVPGRILRALHRFCHRWEPACPDCAANLAKADEWACKCQKAEADWVLLYDDREEARHWYAQRQTVAPGTPILGGVEEGVVSWPVGDADLAVAYDTLLTGQRSRLPQAKPPAEPSGPLTYAQFIASREPRPLVPFPEKQIEAVRGKVRTVVTAANQTVEMCHRRDGKPAITTAEITARAQEMVDAREAP